MKLVPRGQHYRPSKPAPLGLRALSTLTTLILVSSTMTALQLTTTVAPAQASPAPATLSNWNADPNGDVSGAWIKSSGSSAYNTYVSDYPDAAPAGSYLTGPNITNTGNAMVFDTVNTPGDYGSVTSITVNAYLRLNSSGLTGSPDTQTVIPTLTDASGTSLIATPVGQSITAATFTLYSWTVYPKTHDYSATTWNGMRLGISSTYLAVGGADTGSTISVSSLNGAVSYAKRPGKITQQGYIFENDDGAGTPDNNSAQAAGNTAITGVAKGERVDLRTQDLSSTNAETAGASEFYDRGDGYWSKVKSTAKPVTSTGTCADVNFNCTAIDTAAAVDFRTAVAVDSTGKTWVAYYDSTNKHLKVASYVGAGGTGCATTAWNCITVSTGSGTGEGLWASIAIDPANHVWISYWDRANSALMVAENVTGTGCLATTWTCTTVKTSVTMNTIDDRTSIAIGPGDVPWVAYHSSSNVYLASYASAGGSGCTSAAWNGCTLIDGGSGGWFSLGFSPTGVPWIAVSSSNNLEVDHYTGASSSGCTIATWTCEGLETMGATTDQDISLAFAPDGNPWVSYEDSASLSLKIAKYLGGATSGTTCPAINTWDCSVVDSSGGDTGYDTSLAFDPSGAAWITYYDNTNGDLKLARYAGGTSGNCTSTAWKCATIESSGDVGGYTSLAFGPDGTAWISYVYGTGKDLRVANLNRGGEIITGSSLSAPVNNSAITKSHSDMTSVSDSTAKASANCISGTWVNGLSSQTSEINAVSIPAGDCTELMFTLDTAQAQDNTTYRFVTAFNDNASSGHSYWQGPASITQYPSLTTATSTTVRVSKDAPYKDNSSCTGAAVGWSCSLIETTDVEGVANAIAISPSGVPWMVWEDTTAPGTMRYAYYVGGSSGTGCNGASTGAWTCGDLDTTTVTYATSGNYAGEGTVSMKFAQDGTLWVSWWGYLAGVGSSSLKVAKYVGTGGTGCGTASAWSCTQVDTNGGTGAANATGLIPSLAIDATGVPMISYFDNKHLTLRLARFVGAGGVGCTSTSWSCTTIATNSATAFTVGAGQIGSSALVIDSNGIPIIGYQYYNVGAYAARYVGAGGNCTDPAWSCTVIDGTSGSGTARYMTGIVDSSGNVVFSFLQSSTAYLMVARYLNGGSASSCTTGTTWSCQVVDNVANVYTTMALDSAGHIWIVSKENATGKRRLTEYVGGTSGNCPGNGTVAATDWNCSYIYGQSGFQTSSWGSIAFDNSGMPWVAEYNQNNNDLAVLKMTLPGNQPSYTSAASVGVPNAGARSGDLRLRLDSGLSARPSTCAAASAGYCGITANDSNSDQMVAQPGEQPLYDFAERSSTNSSFPAYRWHGQSTVATSAANMHIQVFNVSTQSWSSDLASDSTTGANTPLTLIGQTSAGSASNYYEADGANYWTYFRVYQDSYTTAETLSTDSFIAGGNTPPSAPTSLAQFKSDGVTSIATGGYTNETTVVLSATVSDPDSDFTSLCAEVASTLTNPASPSTCGTAVASGSTATVTVTGLTPGTAYKWQVKAKDANAAYSTTYTQFAAGASAFIVDTTAPVTGTVYDGNTAGTDVNFNSGSLSSLSCAWNGFSDSGSGLASYSYAIGTNTYANDPTHANDISNWKLVTAPASTDTATGLTLSTSVTYYCNVKAVDAVGNVSGVVSSDGQRVAPTLTFNVSTNAVNFTNLNPGNSFTNTQSLNLTTSSNAYNGYAISAYESQPLTYGAQTIADYASPATAPTTWTGTGFGYTLSGGATSSVFAGSKYAHFGTAGAPDTPIVHSGPISATPITTEVEAMTLKVSSSLLQPAGAYQNRLVFSCVATY